MANDQEGVLHGNAHLGKGRTLTPKLSSGDAAKLSLFKMLAPAQLWKLPSRPAPPPGALLGLAGWGFMLLFAKPA